MLAILDRVHRDIIVLTGDLDQVIQDGWVIFYKVDRLIPGYSILDTLVDSLREPYLLVRDVSGIGREAYIDDPENVDPEVHDYPRCSYARGIEEEQKDFSLADLMTDLDKLFEESFPRSIETRVKIPKDIWTISGNAMQLHQVLMNLCLNARDAMLGGGVLTITAENVLVDENYAKMNLDAKVGPYVVITVSDTGTGMPPAVQERLFEPFFTTKEVGKGAGLGLPTSLGIVEGHRGFILVHSEVGKGTSFKVHFPAIKVPVGKN